MISLTAEYALRIVVFLASLNDQPATTAQISATTRVPQGYLSKILRQLSKGNLVLSQRGLHGGSRLARPARRMTVWDVVDVVDPIQRIRTCPLGLASHSVSLCPLHHRLDTAIASVESAFRETTIADVVAEPSDSKPLVDGIPTLPASGLVPARVLKRGKST